MAWALAQGFELKLGRLSAPAFAQADRAIRITSLPIMNRILFLIISLCALRPSNAAAPAPAQPEGF